MNLYGVGVSRSERLAPVGEAPAKSDPFMPSPDLSLAQKMVLLKLRKGEVAAAILAKLREMSAPEPGSADWRAMIDVRYIRRSFATSNTGRLELMPAGLSIAGAIMRELAPKYGVHVISYRPAASRTNMGASASCSCGKWHQAVGRSRSDDARLRRRAGEHLEAVKAGTLKTPRPLHDFLNEIAPPRLPLEARDG